MKNINLYILTLLLLMLSDIFVSANVTDRKGWWKFDDKNSLLQAETGYEASLNLVGTHTETNGYKEGDGAVLIGVGSYYELIHKIEANGGGKKVNEYSLQVDFKIPVSGVWYSFFQTNASNNDDGELFINTSGKIGVAAVGYSNFSVIPDEWYRLVVTVKNGNEFCYYIDGNLILSGKSQPIDGRFSLNDKLLIFADNDKEDGDIYCSELAIWDKCLTESEVNELGRCTLNPSYLITRIPYLQSLGQSSVIISWHDATIETPMVEYGKDSLNLLHSTAGESETMNLPYRWHTVKLNGLESHCRYYYRVSSGGITSEIYSFSTLPESTSTSKLRFLILGDTHSSDTTMAGKVIRSAREKMIEKYGWNFSDSVQGIIHTGDIVVDGNTLEHYTKQFFKPLSSLTPYLATTVVAGNHEAENAFFYKYMKLDGLSALPQLASLNEKIWHFKSGNSLFIGLNTNIYNEYGFFQAEWLNERLNTAESDSDIDFIFLFFHHPPFSELWKYVNTNDGSSAYVSKSLLPIIKKYTKVKEIHYGHTHGFERGTLMAENHEGDFRIICGGGGGGYLDPWTAGENEDLSDIHKTISQYFYQILEIDPKESSFTNTAYSLGTLSKHINSEVLDRWYISIKQEAPKTPIIVKADISEYYLDIESSEFEGEDSIMSKQIQFIDSFDSVLLDTVLHKQNIYGIDAFQNPVDLNKNINFYEFRLTRGQFENNKQYKIRIRYRDNNLKWSQWSDYYMIIPNGIQQLTKDKEMIQNYPNPFIKETKIKYSIREPSDVVLNIYSLDNRLIFNTNRNNQSSGDYVIDYKPLDLSPGVYVYQLQTKNKLLTGKMIKSQ